MGECRVKNLYRVSYLMEMGFGVDVWRIHGFYNDRPIYTSRPVAFDEDNLVITTFSGSKYKICSWNENCKYIHDLFIEQIKKDIINGGYETH